MTDEPVLILYASSLCSKWGFSDGDIVREFLLDLMDHGLLEEHDNVPLRDPYKVDKHAVLRQLVRERLLPQLPFEIETYDIETCHNPIRARTVDGREVEERIWSDLDERLNQYSVEIPWRDVVRASGLEVVRGVVLNNCTFNPELTCRRVMADGNGHCCKEYDQYPAALEQARQRIEGSSERRRID